jgi:hypothetical protein
MGGGRTFIYALLVLDFTDCRNRIIVLLIMGALAKKRSIIGKILTYIPIFPHSESLFNLYKLHKNL